MSLLLFIWHMILASSVPFFGLSALRVVLAVLWLAVVCGCLLLCPTSSDLPRSAGWGGWYEVGMVARIVVRVR